MFQRVNASPMPKIIGMMPNTAKMMKCGAMYGKACQMEFLRFMDDAADPIVDVLLITIPPESRFGPGP